MILVAVLSVGNSSVYGASRTLSSLAEQGQAPRFLAYIDRKGRPILAIALTSAFGLLCFLAASDKQTVVFEWLMAIVGLGEIFVWGSICLCHIRFRAGWKYQGRRLDELSFQSQPGLIGSWIGFGFNCLVMIAQFLTAAWPSDYGSMTVASRASTFFSYYLALPVVLFLYVAYKFWYGTKIVRANEMDLVTGCRFFDNDQLSELQAADRATRSIWQRVLNLLF